MEHGENDNLQPIHQYIQIVDEQKFIVFLYQTHAKRYVHINGFEKKMAECEMARKFRVDGQWYKYQNDRWTLL